MSNTQLALALAVEAKASQSPAFFDTATLDLANKFLHWLETNA